MKKETQDQINKLQLIEQNVNSLVVQKQTFQQQLTEIDNALQELEKTKGECYKIVGNIMVSSEPESLKKELSSKKEVTELRIKSLEKQEQKLKEEASTLQKEIMKDLKK